MSLHLVLLEWDGSFSVNKLFGTRKLPVQVETSYFESTDCFNEQELKFPSCTITLSVSRTSQTRLEGPSDTGAAKGEHESLRSYYR